MLLVPGFVLVRLGLGARPRDAWVRAALAVGAGLAFWPVLLLFTARLGIRWGPGPTRILLVLCAAGLAVFFLRRPAWRLRVPLFPSRILLLVLALAAATRCIQVGGLALPPWVDSVHHHAVAAAILERGGVPESYGPALPGVPAVYHWGFHAGLAATAWLLGLDDPFALARLLLHYGQLLNALTVLALYAMARVLFASRWAGVVAALLAGLVSWYPAYYVAWGRYPQLAGALLVVPLAIAFRDLGRPGGPRRPAFVGFLASGLLLVHVRVAFFAATLLVLLAPHVLRRSGRRGARGVALAAAVTLVLSAPWLATLLRQGMAERALAPTSTRELERWRSYNQAPQELLLSPNARELVSAASLGLTGMAGWAGMPLAGRLLSGGLWVAILFAARRRRRIPWHPLSLLWGWGALTMLLINLDRLGLPPLRLVPNSAAVIFAFLPLCAAAGGVLAWAGRLLPAALRTRTTATAALAGASLWGASQLLDVVPPWTVLATERDVAALRWVAERTPPAAVFAVRAMPWVGGTVVGRDGGYWLSVLTHRRSIVPPALYPFLPERLLTPLAARLDAWVDVRSPDEPAAASIFQEELVTHLFVGESSGPLDALSVAGSRAFRPLRRDGPTAVFERVPPVPAR